MKLVKPSVEMIWVTPDPLETIEKAGRTCYKSEDKITPGSAEKFVRMLLSRGHEAMIEHASMAMRFVCDRGVTHEIVRHRLFSFAQESTRYCNYKGGVEFIIPCWMYDTIGEGEYVVEQMSIIFKDTQQVTLSAAERLFVYNLYDDECSYKAYIDKFKWTPQQARSILPNSLKTEIVVTGNMREWRHFFRLRTDAAAHPQMQEVANMALVEATTVVPVLFEEFDV